MANRHHKRYMGNQAVCEPIDTGTDQTTGDSVHGISILNIT